MCEQSEDMNSPFSHFNGGTRENTLFTNGAADKNYEMYRKQ